MVQKFTSISARAIAGMVFAALAALTSGCASRGPSAVNRAPVEDRSPSARAPAVALPGALPGSSSTAPAVVAPAPSTGAVAAAPAGVPVAPPRVLPGAENAGKPGYYTVKPGDSLIRIGLDHGHTFRDIARWNGLDNPNVIEVGQVLRVVPPVPGSPTAVAATTAASGPVSNPVLSPSSVFGTSLPPLGTRTAQPSATPAAPPAIVPPLVAAVPAPAAPVSSPAATAGDDDVAWIWPAAGSVLAGFDEVKNKGLDIAGKLGDPVLAAGDGRVVYAGSGLRGYGNLVILKHNNTFLTAYAHNQALLVKEDQTVRKGQKIAELGQSDTDRAKLHFEIRRQGKPVDPARYLPAR